MEHNQIDPTTADDQRRISAAREHARRRILAIVRRTRRSMRHIFEQEIGETVRSVSPFLLSLVASQGASLDEVVDTIKPAADWLHPTASLFISGYPPWSLNATSGRYRRHTFVGSQKSIWPSPAVHGATFMRSGKDWARIQVIDHSLEVDAQVGPVRFATLFGALRVELQCRLPEALATAGIGRPIGDIIEHAALRARDWPIVAIEDPYSPILGQTLIVATGSLAFRMPWAR